MKYILNGTIVTLNDKKEIINDGIIGINNNIISFVCKYEHEFPFDFKDTPIINTKGYIYPGLIDLHNHFSFNFLDLWNGIDRKFRERYEWKKLKKYQQEIVAPAKLLANSNPIEVIKYSEVKALVSGTTSFGGLAYFNKEYFAWLLRNLEKNNNFDVQTFPILFQNVIPLTKTKDFIDADKKMKKGISYIYHLAEGNSEILLKEFNDLKSHNLVREKFIGVHCTALNSKSLKVMGLNKAKLIWSPLSNHLLYGKTTDIISAKKYNVLICLGSDWSPTGSKNLLWELKVADLINKFELNKIFSPRQLVEMVTINPAQAIGLENKLGRITQGYLADLIVFDKIDNDDPYHNLIISLEKDLKISIINGHIRYYDMDLKHYFKELKLPETITIESINKRIDMFQSIFNYGNNTFEQVHLNLKNALDDLSYTARLLFEKLRSLQKNQKPLQLMIEGNDDPMIHQRAKNTNFNLFIEESFGVKDFSSCNLDSLTTPEDNGFFITINNNPNIPSYLENLKDYVR